MSIGSTHILSLLICLMCGVSTSAYAQGISGTTAGNMVISGNVIYGADVGTGISIKQIECGRDQMMEEIKRLEYADRFMVLQAWGMKK